MKTILIKQIVCLLIIILGYTSIEAQVPNIISLIGTLQLADNTIITYKISYEETATSAIKGNSLTDIYGADKTVTAIEGRINHKEKKISFKETANISTQSKSDEAMFCFIEVVDARIREVAGKTIIQGKFTGKFSSGKTCASGTIYLISTSYIDKIAQKVLTPKNIKNKDTLNMLNEKLNEAKEPLYYNQIGHKSNLNLTWKGTELIIEIWDGQKEDQDEIEVYVNDKRVLDRFTIRREKKTLIIPLTQPENIVKIIGVSEGKSAPCTATILLRDGAKLFPLVAELKKGESAQITLKR
jgi:hypothetical protein